MTHDTKSNRKNESKEWISNALLDLMTVQTYQEITVTELSKRADLSRRTFYRHFDTVDDVLSYIIEQVAAEYLEMRNDVTKHARDFCLITVAHFSFWEERKDFLLLLHKNDMYHFLMDELYKCVYSRLEANTQNSDLERYVYSFSTGGISYMLEKWLLDGATKTPEEMGEVAKEILGYMKL